MTRATPSARRLAALVVAGLALLACCLVVATVANPRAFARSGPDLPVADALSALAGGGDAVARAVVWHARVPRVGVAALVGAALALSGALLQLVLRNPLADPFVLGVSSGAALASVVGLALGFSLGGSAHPLAAALGAALAAALVLRIARGSRELGAVTSTGLSAERVAVAGVVLSYLLSAGVMWVLSLSSAQESQRYLFWLMGSMASASGRDAIAAAVVVAAGILIAMPALPGINLLLVSEEHAADAGVPVERIKLLALAAAALLVGGSVAIAGSIGFVGLVVPHAVRLVAGTDARVSAPLSAIAGACFLVLADLGSRALGEVPVGVVTASLGGPFFLVLLARRRSS